MMGPDTADILLALLPMLLLLGAWYYFVRQMQRGGGELMELRRRKVEALERIAAALEKRG